MISEQPIGSFPTAAVPSAPAAALPLREILPANPARESATPHLAFLDGMRGLAALYVVFHHVYINLSTQFSTGAPDAASRYFKLLHPLAFGHYAVDLFIVLSGYCLMLPVLRNQGNLRGGLSGYLVRRARRILPPYYAALIVSVLLLAGLQRWDSSLALPDIGNILSHVLLLHNLSANYAYSINAPMWSVATEWQIYFLFPVLLWFWRKWGSTAAVVAGFVIGYALFFWVPGGLIGASPWFIGLFALGMAGAALQRAASGTTATVFRKTPWGIVSLMCLGLLVAVGIARQGSFKTHPYLIDPLFGLAAVSLLLYCVQGKPSFLLRLCNSRGAVALGAFSYSLYLIHYPLLDVATILLRQWRLPLTFQAPLLFLLFIPLTVAVAFGFYVLFERPFLSVRQIPAPLQPGTMKGNS